MNTSAHHIQTVISAPEHAPRDVPPVIAYPEFLVHSSKPPPLVTKSLLLNTAYITAGLYGTFYALSKYIIGPMEAQLSDSRHQFITHATSQMEVFNSRLSDMVSTVPPSRLGTSSKSAKGADHPDNASDITSDRAFPPRLWHTNFAITLTTWLTFRGLIPSHTTRYSDRPRKPPQNHGLPYQRAARI